jgi:hypothetical protein
VCNRVEQEVQERGVEAEKKIKESFQAMHTALQVAIAWHFIHTVIHGPSSNCLWVVRDVVRTTISIKYRFVQEQEQTKLAAVSATTNCKSKQLRAQQDAFATTLVRVTFGLFVLLLFRLNFIRTLFVFICI